MNFGTPWSENTSHNSKINKSNELFLKCFTVANTNMYIILLTLVYTQPQCVNSNVTMSHSYFMNKLSCPHKLLIQTDIFPFVRSKHRAFTFTVYEIDDNAAKICSLRYFQF